MWHVEGYKTSVSEDPKALSSPIYLPAGPCFTCLGLWWRLSGMHESRGRCYLPVTQKISFTRENCLALWFYGHVIVREEKSWTKPSAHLALAYVFGSTAFAKCGPPVKVWGLLNTKKLSNASQLQCQLCWATVCFSIVNICRVFNHPLNVSFVISDSLH